MWAVHATEELAVAERAHLQAAELVVQATLGCAAVPTVLLEVVTGVLGGRVRQSRIVDAADINCPGAAFLAVHFTAAVAAGIVRFRG